MTREDIEKLNVVEPYCFESDREEQWYQVGLQEGLDVADNHPKSPWISVKDDLPCNNPNFIHFGFTNRVLVRSKKGNLFIAYMKKNEDNKWIWCNDVDDNFDLLSYITHWMYIPKIEKD